MIDEGEEPELPGENIAVDDDRTFAAYADSDLDNGDFEDFDFDQICGNIMLPYDIAKMTEFKISWLTNMDHTNRMCSSALRI